MLKNLFPKVGMFFLTTKAPHNSPRFTSNSPRSYHQKTTKITQIPQNPPKNHRKKN
jgi:hypothetical protein